jgi:hypothetical protein
MLQISLLNALKINPKAISLTEIKCKDFETVYIGETKLKIEKRKKKRGRAWIIIVLLRQ